MSFFHLPYPRKTNYVVIDTDYENYSVVFACIFKPMVWVLSRTPQLNPEIFSKAQQVMQDKIPNFEFSWLEDITH